MVLIKKQATPKVAFVFLGPLTKVQPANAGSRARKCEDLSLAFGLTAGGYTGNGTGRY